MTDKEFREYVMEQKRIGLDNHQIATKLGMDPGIFEDACKFAFEEPPEEPVPVVVPKETINKISEEPRKEKVPGIYYVPQGDEETFKDSPINKKNEKADS